MGNTLTGMDKALNKIREIKASLDGHMSRIEAHQNNGVFFVDAKNVLISPEAIIGENTIVYPDVIIEGNCIIGKGVILYPGTRLHNANIGNYSEIQQSVVLDSSIGEETTVGPYAYIRPDSVIGSHVKIGDFVEVKKSTIGDGTKVSHLTYLGDAKIGAHVNFGCGTVIVNYDGKVKQETIIEDHAFIGCNTNLIAPVRVGRNAYTAAGSTITKDVPANALAISRVHQENKEGWVEQKGLKKD